jgi:hypothetical protein
VVVAAAARGEDVGGDGDHGLLILRASKMGGELIDRRAGRNSGWR